MKKLAVMFLSIALLFSGCGQVSSNVDMSPRLITVGDDLNTASIVGAVQSAVVGIAAGNSVGSGVAIADGGYVLTNHHVIEGTTKVVLYYADMTNGSGSVVWSDAGLDLAIVKSNKNMPYLDTADSTTLKVGEDVIAIGTPLTLQFKHTVTKGIVSALNRTLEISNLGGTTSYMQNLIQHDASINPGNSGGPLINSEGKVVGINTLKASDAEGIAFAIPIEIANAVTGKVVQNVNYRAPKLGMFGLDASITYQNAISKEQSGVYIVDITKDSLFSESGFKKGDVIIQIGRHQIFDMLDMRKALFSYSPGDTMAITFIRDGKECYTEVSCPEISSIEA